MFLLMGFAFVAGLVTILAPCIWPLIPIVLSSSIAGKGRARPLGVTLGIISSFAIFTLFISYLVRIFNFDPNILRMLAVVVLIFLGIAMIVPMLSGKFELFISRFTSVFGSRVSNTNNGFSSSFVTGAFVGIVWSPCAGPILATIAALSATGKVSFQVVLVTLAYTVGVGIPLFIFAYAGQQIIIKTRGISKYTGKIQQVFGVIMILTAIAIYTNFDQTLQLALLNKIPVLGNAVNGFENSSNVTNQLNLLKGSSNSNLTIDTSGLFNADYPAADFVGISKWLNTDKPINIKDLRGKVVLVDFWTYTCINCIRTLPHVTSWYDKYKNDGFIVIGVHTPEFQFEHDTNNVLAAIKTYGIHYPVAQDNNYVTWNNYNNQYWPAEYLIDVNGNIRRTDFGEGGYEQTEQAIQSLLQEDGKKVKAKLSLTPDNAPTQAISPETYLGSNRMQYYFPSGSLGNGNQNFNLSNDLTPNTFSFGGNWDITKEYASAGKNTSINYNFVASKVYIILNPTVNISSNTIKIYLDGKVIDSSRAGSDVANGLVNVDSDRLYNVVDLRGKTENHILRLDFQTPGVEVFTFTFG